MIVATTTTTTIVMMIVMRAFKVMKAKILTTMMMIMD